MSEIVWEAPPPKRRGVRPRKWQERLAPLMEHEGEWARLEVYDTPGRAADAASYLVKPGVPPPGRWEFAARRIDGGSALYARYLGAEQ